MAIYESVFILRQDLTPQQVDGEVSAFKSVLEGSGAKIIKEENWGLRSLAYRIKKNKKGHYILVESSASAEAVKEFERKLSLSENVLRYMSVRLAEPSKGPSAVLRDKDRDDRFGGFERDNRDKRMGGGYGV
ncbi:MAG: 30S ribosomal protein S6 [Rickettsiales bacterium]|jgi:small subunit ribosomal protein S6|nr:30S ribosomal protein S6 [Rickettsiales bacterium]